MKDGISKVSESDSMQEYIGVVAKKTKNAAKTKYCLPAYMGLDSPSVPKSLSEQPEQNPPTVAFDAIILKYLHVG